MTSQPRPQDSLSRWLRDTIRERRLSYPQLAEEAVDPETRVAVNEHWLARLATGRLRVPPNPAQQGAVAAALGVAKSVVADLALRQWPATVSNLTVGSPEEWVLYVQPNGLADDERDEVGGLIAELVRRQVAQHRRAAGASEFVVTFIRVEKKDMEELAKRGVLAVLYRDAGFRVLIFCAGDHISSAMAQDLSVLSDHGSRARIRPGRPVSPPVPVRFCRVDAMPAHLTSISVTHAAEVITYVDASQITSELARQLEAVTSDATRYSYNLPVVAARLTPETHDAAG